MGDRGGLIIRKHRDKTEHMIENLQKSGSNIMSDRMLRPGNRACDTL